MTLSIENNQDMCPNPPFYHHYCYPWLRLSVPTYSWRNNPLVVVRVDAHGVTLEVEGVLAELDVFQLVLVEVWPAPDTGVDDVREALATCDLKSSVQGSLDGYALAGVCSVGGNSRDQAVQLIAFFL